MVGAATSAELVTVTPDPALAPDLAPALARCLEAEGLPVRGRRVVVADEGLVERALRETVRGGGVVVCFGDGEGAAVLRQALARVLGVRLVLSDRLLDALSAAYARHGRAMPRRAEGLALVPQGATVLVPAAGGEPGFLVEVDGVPVAVLPAEVAVASELVRQRLLGAGSRRDAEPVTLARTLRVIGLDLVEVEARVATALRGTGSTPARTVEADGEIWVRVRVRGASAAAAESAFRALEPTLRAQLGVAWFGVDDETLEVVVGRLLRGRGLTVALAESCTGGLVGHRLTQVPGSSAYLERGLVVYSNAAKQALLDVPEAVLRQHGAVSTECAEAMARGVRRQAGTDLGLSVTGIAGPEGGSAVKPVGTVFIGLADRETALVRRHRFDRDREGNKLLSAVMALDLLRRYCLGALE